MNEMGKSMYWQQTCLYKCTTLSIPINFCQSSHCLPAVSWSDLTGCIENGLSGYQEGETSSRFIAMIVPMVILQRVTQCYMVSDGNLVLYGFRNLWSSFWCWTYYSNDLSGASWCLRPGSIWCCTCCISCWVSTFHQTFNFSDTSDPMAANTSH